MGNIGSIKNMLKHIGVKSYISSKALDIINADRLILAGVGAFDEAMKRITELGLLEILNEIALKNKVPVLGICLGMQILSERSEEGSLPGLGWIKGECVKFSFSGNSKELKIPHMGWNIVNIIKKENKLFKVMPDESRFYFVHSYHMVCENEKDALCITRHGYDFVSAVERENIYGTQFHPEKSHKFGMQLLKNFVELY